MFEILECDQALKCKNSIEVAGDQRQKCYLCRLSPESDGKGSIYWKAVDGHSKHPVLVKEKSDQEFATRKARIDKRQNRNKAKMTISWKAAKSEKSAEDLMVKATKNSGRSNRDGDLQASNFIGLDNKLQTNNTEPIVHLAELDKAIADAKRGGMLIGGLVIETKNGVSVTVFKTEDFAKEILTRL